MDLRETKDITKLLLASARGQDGAMDQVFASVYPRLRELARSRRRQWKGNETLSTTALIHEAYLKLADSDSRFEDRGHFFAVAARAMRQVLVNYAEYRSAAKRGGDAVKVPVQDSDLVQEEALEELLDLEDALRRLEELSLRQAKVVECLFFAGLSVAETAEATDTSPATVKRDWSAARAWLHREMRGRANPEG
ncbi:MAG: sigma-70 family RNA polymerase sigma factor [Gemmatimonadetes bacterium]|nr:sigma-70 family RNA polymerase sigma factor [Gemmatimonadota bacterium]NIR76858.1 sigma-70 family RNA polymerase sigma factor [Gemmatimonadota bacterium]NIT85377.1 sigma-70 family RNA polymerase sigma factor [Gemmatimonadota bacterium]NIU29198.1 sigma-70 family RNA polymerase sigma factor [Gemmatimonadota bacterium]NIU34295.1 sigma-70 family RNA polymerase sigma factor [Gemmatimonadota bacterium]